MTQLIQVVRRFGSTAALAALIVAGAACGAIQGASVQTVAQQVAAHDAAGRENWISADSQYGVASATDTQAATAPCDSTCLVP
jgi:hypothetical protein